MKDFLESMFETSAPYELIDWQIIGHQVTLRKDFGVHAAGSYFSFVVVDLENKELRLENANEELEDGDEDALLISKYPFEYRIHARQENKQ